MSSAGGVLRVREHGRPERDAVIGLSEACELTQLGNYPDEEIRRGLRDPAGIVLVVAGPDERVASVMVGHGDYVELTGHNGLIVYGRSDAVLNPGGVRIGTAEIYRQVEQLDEVVEALVIGQEWDDDTRVVLFVTLREDVALDEALERRIRTQIRENATPRHVPAKIVEVADIPRTKSGKLVELAVRELVHGRPVKNIEALANPEALAHFEDRVELAR